jgi:type 1 glutamine amidotransferase
MSKPADIVILSGEGPHADPWHPLPETSARMAEILGTENSVTVVTAIDDLAAKLEGADVLLVNASAYRTTPIPDDETFARVLDGFLARGGNLLATHSAALAFPGVAGWRSALGATWELGKSFHPPIGRTLIQQSGVQHPISEGLGDFWIYDERYTDLDFVDQSEIVPLYVHTEGGVRHPLVWARTVGNSRVVYDALGHDTNSFEAPEHVELLKRSVSWLRTRS